MPSTNISEQNQQIQSEHSQAAQAHQGGNVPLNTSSTFESQLNECLLALFHSRQQFSNLGRKYEMTA